MSLRPVTGSVATARHQVPNPKPSDSNKTQTVAFVIFSILGFILSSIFFKGLGIIAFGCIALLIGTVLFKNKDSCIRRVNEYLPSFSSIFRPSPTSPNNDRFSSPNRDRFSSPNNSRFSTPVSTPVKHLPGGGYTRSSYTSPSTAASRVSGYSFGGSPHRAGVQKHQVPLTRDGCAIS